MLAADSATDIQANTARKKLRENWNAPDRHFKKIPRFEGEWGDAWTLVKSKLGKGVIIALVGNRGNGKTQLGVEAMRHVTHELKPALYETATGFFLRIKETYVRDKGISERDVIRELRRPALLILDEIGKRSDTEWENRLLFHVIDCRYMDEKDTIVITNQTKTDFLKSIGPSLASRMSEDGGIVECDWPEFR
jgi:DNA replication protein DnaC